jgi:hypothetical protein
MYVMFRVCSPITIYVCPIFLSSSLTFECNGTENIKPNADEKTYSPYTLQLKPAIQSNSLDRSEGFYEVLRSFIRVS